LCPVLVEGGRRRVVPAPANTFGRDDKAVRDVELAQRVEQLIVGRKLLSGKYLVVADVRAQRRVVHHQRAGGRG